MTSSDIQPPRLSVSSAENLSKRTIHADGNLYSKLPDGWTDPTTRINVMFRPIVGRSAPDVVFDGVQMTGSSAMLATIKRLHGSMDGWFKPLTETNVTVVFPRGLIIPMDTQFPDVDRQDIVWDEDDREVQFDGSRFNFVPAGWEGFVNRMAVRIEPLEGRMLPAVTFGNIDLAAPSTWTFTLERIHRALGDKWSKALPECAVSIMYNKGLNI